VIPKLNYDVILGKPWMEGEDVKIWAKDGQLRIGSTDTAVMNRGVHPLPKVEVYNMLASTFVGEVRRARQKKRSQIYAVTLADIDKALRPKPRSDPKEKLLEYY